MQTNRSSRRRSPALLLPLVLAAACVDGNTPLTPTPEEGLTADVAVMECSVDVHRDPVMVCATIPSASSRLGVATNRIISGQDLYVKLANYGNTYDPDADVYSMSVTIQNLLAAPLGTSDGVTVDGIKVYFVDDPIPSGGGPGEVTVLNPSGVQFFTGPNQPYFLYPQILQPFEISDPLTWQFSTETGNFTFRVAVSAPQANESLPLLDAVWKGLSDTDWNNAANWSNGSVPTSTNTVSVPRSTVVSGPNMPVLTSDAAVAFLHVGLGSTLDMAGYTLTSGGTVDAPGTISNGLVILTGDNSFLRGFLPSVQVTGSASLQGATRTTGPVSVSDGSLTVSGTNALSISIP